MLTLQDQREALRAVTTLVESVHERPVALAVIGEKGCERVWLAEDLETEPGKMWAAAHMHAAADLCSPAIPRDVARLVIAARLVADGNPPSAEALRELDNAAEAFADRVPWDDEPKE